MSDLSIHKHTLLRIAERLEKLQKYLELEANSFDEQSKAADTKKVIDWKEYFRVRGADRRSAALSINKEINIIRGTLL